MRVYNQVIVSNRLPISVARDSSGALEYSRSSGGLATAMSSLGDKNSVWVGWPGIDADDLSSEERTEITKKLQDEGCFPVFLSAEQIELFYEGYANDTLWPLFHYFQSLTIYKDEY